MIPRWWERLGGLFIACCGVWLTWFAWQAAHQQKSFLSVGAAGPGFTLLGLALICIPGYHTERLMRGESLEGKEGLALLTPRWKVLCVLCTLLSVGYLLVLMRG